MLPTANPQVVFGYGDTQLIEEDIGHILIVVLPGMQKDLLNTANFEEGVAHSSSLDKLRASTNYSDNFHDNLNTKNFSSECRD